MDIEGMADAQRRAKGIGARLVAAVLLVLMAIVAGCHGGTEAGPPPPSVEPRQFRLILHTDGNMTRAIVEQRGGNVFGSSEHKKDIVMSYLEELLARVNAIYERNLGVSFYFHPQERSFIDTGVSIFGECGHFSAAEWNDALVSAMDDPPDLASMLEYCPNEPANSRGYSHWNGLCSNGFGESVVTYGVRIDDPEVPRFVAHELGHLMGASHTFGIMHGYTNGDRHFEPGCGSTLMSYGGGMVDDDACDPSQDYVRITDDSFHAYSIGEMQREITDEIHRGTCGRPARPDLVHAPVPTLDVSASDRVVIPARTPFYVRASFAPDPDDAEVSGFDVSFDEIDDDGSESLVGVDHRTNTILRSRIFRDLPAEGGTVVRSVPTFQDVASGKYPREESPASTSRKIDLRVMARALHPYGATTKAVDVHVAVIDTGSAFGKPQYPVEVLPGKSFNVTWDPAGTAASSELHAKSVRLHVCAPSCTGADAFDMPLVDEQRRPTFRNTGSATAVLRAPGPAVDTPHARIVIENEAGTFFDVGRAELTIRALPSMN